MNNRGERSAALVEKIREARQSLSGELVKAGAGQDAVDGLRQLNFIDEKLKELAQQLECNMQSRSSQFSLGIARLVIDTWPLKHPLGELIIEIEYLYGRLKQ